MPDPADPARGNTAMACQMAVWKTLYPSATYTYFDSNIDLQTQYEALLSALPTDIRPEQFPAVQLVWRDEDGRNFGQPWPNLDSQRRRDFAKPLIFRCVDRQSADTSRKCGATLYGAVAS